ncbi:MAG TPA: hypothetical protein VFB33_06035 [Candidatus Binataceae bacterium]|nr:hypothetical protein [Candidatus Binataceae bacterium]
MRAYRKSHWMRGRGAMLALALLSALGVAGCLYVSTSTPASSCITDPPRNGVQVTSCPDPFLGWALPHVTSVPVPTPEAQPSPLSYAPPASPPPSASSGSGLPE